MNDETLTGAIPPGPVTDSTEFVFVAGRAFVDAKRHEQTVGRCAADRDRWVRLFNRLEAAVSHHQQADCFKDDHDEALYAARDRVLRDLAQGNG